MSEPNLKRRHLLKAAAAGFAATELNFMGVTQVFATQSGTLRELAPLKQIDAGVLNVGYYERGPADGPVVILLHGFPYDIHSYIDVAPMLATRGCRVIVPHLRGHGTTRFL